MPEPVIRKVSRKFAAGVIADGPATAKDIALLLSMIAPACADDREGYRDEVLFGPQVVGVRNVLGCLVQDADVPRIVSLAPLMARLRQTKVSYAHYRSKSTRPWHTAFHGLENDEPGQQRASDGVTCHVDKLIVASGHWPSDPRGGAVDVDIAALRAFQCRYSAILYLRALAWMPGGMINIKQTWQHQRLATGVTTLTVPLKDVCDALGTTGFTQPSKITQNVLEPAVADLRRVGIDFRSHWIAVPGYERVHSHLVLSFARTGAATQETPAKRRGRPPKARVEGMAA